jgi:hypothetical protein
MPRVESIAGRDEPLSTRALPYLVGAACLAYALGLLCFGRSLSWDEVEYYRASDWVREGLVPYRDFYEHHAPLQWFLFAPVTALRAGPGTESVLAMRLAQLPFWFATLALLRACARRCGASPGAATAAVLALVSSAAFAHSAIEFRVDTLGTFFLVGALFLVLEDDRRPAVRLLTGAALAGAGLANLRLAPLVAVFFLLASIYSPRGGGWRWNGSLPWMALGGALGAAPAAAYFAAHGALRAAAVALFADNSAADAALERPSGLFAGRVSALLGLGSWSREPGWESVLALDLAGIALSLLGLVGAARALVRLREGRPEALVAVVQLTGILFVMRMKAIYDYHFQVSLALAPLLVPAGLGRRALARARPLLLAVALSGLALGAANLALRNLGPALAHQELVMSEVERLVPPGAAVWDGVGFALKRRAPRSDLWFLPTLVRVLARSGRFEPIGVEELSRDPPGAILFTTRMRFWFKDWPAVGQWVVRHYAPHRQHLWLPTPNALLAPGAGAIAWTGAPPGKYRIVASEALAAHPWFRSPFGVGLLDAPGKERLEFGVVDHEARPAALAAFAWSVGGRAVASEGNVLALEASESIELRWSGAPRALGLFLVPVSTERLFRMAPAGANLDLPPRFARLRPPAARSE